MSTEYVQTLKETWKSKRGERERERERNRERGTETHWMKLEHLKNVVAKHIEELKQTEGRRDLRRLKMKKKMKNWISISTKWRLLPDVGLIAWKVVENYDEKEWIN